MAFKNKLAYVKKTTTHQHVTKQLKKTAKERISILTNTCRNDPECNKRHKKKLLNKVYTIGDIIRRSNIHLIGFQEKYNSEKM